MAKGARRSIRNPEVVRGVRRNGRVETQHSKGKWRHTKKTSKLTAEQKKSKVVESRKVARAKRDITKKRFYEADDTKVPLRSNKGAPKTAKLRKTITPGTVLIVLAGRFRGKRVVFLKQLKSGLLLVTGPFKINGVPLRRLNQAYVIATSTKVPLGTLDVSKINDDFFKRVSSSSSSSSSSDKKFLESKTGDKKKGERSAEKKAEQKKSGWSHYTNNQKSTTIGSLFKC